MQILYATDGSEGALEGARFLKSLPLDEQSRIDVLAVVEHDTQQTGEPALSRTLSALEGTSASLVQHTRAGNAAEQILDAADEMKPDLVVVGTRGLSAISRFLLGSVAERIARHVPCPVLLARPLRGNLDRIILGVDDSQYSANAVNWFRGLPLPSGCEIRLATLVTPADTVTYSRMMAVSAVADTLITLAHQEKDEAQERLEAMAAGFASAGRNVTTEVQEHEPAQGLIDMAQDREADLVVVGAQGLSGFDRFLIGSVSDRVLRYAPCSVLVIRQPAGAAATPA